jgi:hypothetical protein
MDIRLLLGNDLGTVHCFEGLSGWQYCYAKDKSALIAVSVPRQNDDSTLAVMALTSISMEFPQNSSNAFTLVLVPGLLTARRSYKREIKDTQSCVVNGSH